MASRQSTLGQHVPHECGRPRPSISDRGIIFWRYVIAHDLKDLMERLVRLLVPSDLERDGIVAIPSLFCAEVSYVPRTDNPVGPQNPLEYIVHMRRTVAYDLFGRYETMLSVRNPSNDETHRSLHSHSSAVGTLPIPLESVDPTSSPQQGLRNLWRCQKKRIINSVV